jgi:hypothetical protein
MRGPLITLPNQGEDFKIGELRMSAVFREASLQVGLELYELILGPFIIDYHVHRNMDETLCVIEASRVHCSR